MTPMMVTSGGRLRVGKRPRRRTARRTPSRSRAPIGFSPAGHSFAAASLIDRDAIAAPDLRRHRTSGRAAAGCRTSADDRRPTRLTSMRRDSSAVWPTIVNGVCGPPNGTRRSPPRRPAGADPLEQILREAIALLERRVLRRRQRHADQQHVLGVDARCPCSAARRTCARSARR